MTVLHECLDNDSPWLICKHCGAVGRCDLETKSDSPPTRESVDDALLIVGSYGQWGPDLNDAHRRQIVLADEVLTLRERLAHWRSFAIHAEEEHAAWKKTAIELDAELRALRDPAPLVAWITEGGCECLQRGEGPVRVMPEEDQETGFTVPLYARERPAKQKDCRECAMQPCDTCPDVPGADDVRLMRQAMDALIAHRRQTRPIATTEDAIEALRKRLGPNVELTGRRSG